jgi:hypothetical protein
MNFKDLINEGRNKLSGHSRTSRIAPEMMRNDRLLNVGDVVNTKHETGYCRIDSG